jgi:hypothetical protein
MKRRSGSLWQARRARRFAGVAFIVGLLAACGPSIQARSGSNSGQFAVGAAGIYQYTVSTVASAGGQAYLKLVNNSDSCEEPCSAAPGSVRAGNSAIWEVQLPISDAASTATGTVYLTAGNYTAELDYETSWLLTLSPAG